VYQLKSLDFNEREAKLVERMPLQEIEKIKELVQVLIA
jgi:hypothetical protein